MTVGVGAIFNICRGPRFSFLPRSVSRKSISPLYPIEAFKFPEPTAYRPARTASLRTIMDFGQLHAGNYYWKWIR